MDGESDLKIATPSQALQAWCQLNEGDRFEGWLRGDDELVPEKLHDSLSEWRRIVREAHDCRAVALRQQSQHSETTDDTTPTDSVGAGVPTDESAALHDLRIRVLRACQRAAQCYQGAGGPAPSSFALFPIPDIVRFAAGDGESPEYVPTAMQVLAAVSEADRSAFGGGTQAATRVLTAVWRLMWPLCDDGQISLWQTEHATEAELALRIVSGLFTAHFGAPAASQRAASDGDPQLPLDEVQSRRVRGHAVLAMLGKPPSEGRPEDERLLRMHMETLCMCCCEPAAAHEELRDSHLGKNLAAFAAPTPQAVSPQRHEPADGPAALQFPAASVALLARNSMLKALSDDVRPFLSLLSVRQVVHTHSQVLVSAQSAASESAVRGAVAVLHLHCFAPHVCRPCPSSRELITLTASTLREVLHQRRRGPLVDTMNFLISLLQHPISRQLECQWVDVLHLCDGVARLGMQGQLPGEGDVPRLLAERLVRLLLERAAEAQLSDSDTEQAFALGSATLPYWRLGPELDGALATMVAQNDILKAATDAPTDGDAAAAVADVIRRHSGPEYSPDMREVCERAFRVLSDVQQPRRRRRHTLRVRRGLLRLVATVATSSKHGVLLHIDDFPHSECTLCDVQKMGSVSESIGAVLEGLRVTVVQPGGAAASHGVSPGCVVTQVDSMPCMGPADLQEFFQRAQKRVALTFRAPDYGDYVTEYLERWLADPVPGCASHRDLYWKELLRLAAGLIGQPEATRSVSRFTLDHGRRVLQAMIRSCRRRIRGDAVQAAETWNVMVELLRTCEYSWVRVAIITHFISLHSGPDGTVLCRGPDSDAAVACSPPVRAVARPRGPCEAELPVAAVLAAIAERLSSQRDGASARDEVPRMLQLVQAWLECRLVTFHAQADGPLADGSLAAACTAVVEAVRVRAESKHSDGAESRQVLRRMLLTARAMSSLCRVSATPLGEDVQLKIIAVHSALLRRCCEHAASAGAQEARSGGGNWALLTASVCTSTHSLLTDVAVGPSAKVAAAVAGMVQSVAELVDGIRAAGVVDAFLFAPQPPPTQPQPQATGLGSSQASAPPTPRVMSDPQPPSVTSPSTCTPQAAPAAPPQPEAEPAAPVPPPEAKMAGIPSVESVAMITDHGGSVASQPAAPPSPLTAAAPAFHSGVPAPPATPSPGGATGRNSPQQEGPSSAQVSRPPSPKAVVARGLEPLVKTSPPRVGGRQPGSPAGAAGSGQSDESSGAGGIRGLLVAVLALLHGIATTCEGRSEQGSGTGSSTRGWVAALCDLVKPLLNPSSPQRLHRLAHVAVVECFIRCDAAGRGMMLSGDSSVLAALTALLQQSETEKPQSQSPSRARSVAQVFAPPKESNILVRATADILWRSALFGSCESHPRWEPHFGALFGGLSASNCAAWAGSGPQGPFVVTVLQGQHQNTLVSCRTIAGIYCWVSRVMHSPLPGLSPTPAPAAPSAAGPDKLTRSATVPPDVLRTAAPVSAAQVAAEQVSRYSKTEGPKRLPPPQLDTSDLSQRAATTGEPALVPKSPQHGERSETCSVASDTPEQKPAVQQPTVSPLFPFAAFKVSPPPRRLRYDDDFLKFVNNVDKTPIKETYRVGVVRLSAAQCARRRRAQTPEALQRLELEVLACAGGSERYQRFLHGLGRYHDVRKQQHPYESLPAGTWPPGAVYAGGLDPRGADGEVMLIWESTLHQAAYHIATLMPGVKNPEAVEDDALHAAAHRANRAIGNDHVLIVYAEDSEELDPFFMLNELNYVIVLVQPLPGNLNQVRAHLRPFRGGHWAVEREKDVFVGMNADTMPADNLLACQSKCFEQGYGGFAVLGGTAYFRKQSRADLASALETAPVHTGVTFYLAPEWDGEWYELAAEVRDAGIGPLLPGVNIVHDDRLGECVRSAALHASLLTKSYRVTSGLGYQTNWGYRYQQLSRALSKYQVRPEQYTAVDVAAAQWHFAG